eukprot:gnl/MRDRNA2_/MRDRNA2_86176_c0_seq1.p2 gnl/MRDRNA2_/MRDRNA2_86176_c0~~gnl/MRDRNA2_/MRDRNA2_86176_c0_seq1.p2  ORF type:complete len:111 (+),score=6.88 gnl/MRDRNA2_/MRDRNA2_86176_c0_seq1:399-731(+)
MLDTEEWLKKQKVLLDNSKLESLATKRIHSDSSGKGVTASYADRARNLRISKVDESIPALPGFAPDQVCVTRFPPVKPNDGLVHHPKLFKFVICDEYPSMSYSDLNNERE